MSSMQTLHLDSPRPEGAALHTRRTAAITTLAIVFLGGFALLFLDRGQAPSSVRTEPSTDASAMTTQPNGAATSGGATTAPTETPAVPAGTKMTLEIVEPQTGAEPKVGNPVVATLVSPLEVEGSVVVPAGAKLVGHVTETLPGDDKSADAIFGVAFDTIEVDGKSAPIVADIEGKRLDLAAGRQIEIELGQSLEIDLPAAS